MYKRQILLNELTRFNPELVDKQRILAISKCDMLDDELMAEIEKELPENVPHVFISAVSGLGIQQLKDMLWGAVTDEANRIDAINITHRRLDGHHRVREEDEFIFENEPVDANPDDEALDGEWDEDWDEEWEDYDGSGDSQS